jgi:putative transposase
MRNALYCKPKHSTQVDYLKNKYKDNQQWQALKETAKKLKPHNLTYVIKRVKASFKTYFKSLELYNQNPNLFTGVPKPPKPKKLSKLTSYCIELDKYFVFCKIRKGKFSGRQLV